MPRMSRKCNRRTPPTRHPYAWLSAGAVTFGIGAALASGGAIASADTGRTVTGQGTISSSSISTPKTQTGIRQQRAQARSVPSASGHAFPASSVDVDARSSNGGHPSARVLASPQRRAASSRPARSRGAAATAFADAEGALPAEDTWGNKSYLPDNEVIVPGSAVRLALQQIDASRDVLRSQTWGVGNVFAGFASIAPQLLLAQAARSLTTWQNRIEGAKASVADTVDVPITHQLAQLSLLGTLLLPTVAGVTLDVASLFIPVVGAFGASEAASLASQLVDGAEQNGKVYAVRLLRTVDTTQQIVYLSVNGGPAAPVQLDTGSSGLSVLTRYVGQENLGKPGKAGSSGYGDDTIGVEYNYHYYLTTFSIGNRVSTAPVNVMIVDPESEAVYNNYGTASNGVVGTLGVAANSGSGPTPNALLPGELRDGILLYQNIIGPWGLVVFGPNPLPAKGSVAGAPIGDVQIQIDDGPLQSLKTNIDSGGVNGTIPASIAGSAATGSKLKAGTQVTVYTADGQTVLYTYTVTDSNSPTVYDEATATSTHPNTGNIPFNLGPIYLDYSPPGGLGATYFDYF